MSNVNIFQNGTKVLPKSDAQIVRVDMESSDIGGRKSHLPAQNRAEDMAISHVAHSGSDK